MSLLQHQSLKASVLWHTVFFMVQLSYPYLTMGKTIVRMAIIKKNETINAGENMEKRELCYIVGGNIN